MQQTELTLAITTANDCTLALLVVSLALAEFNDWLIQHDATLEHEAWANACQQ
jgi:hypothetical protein